MLPNRKVGLIKLLAIAWISCICFFGFAKAEDEKCLTQKMLISCSARSPGVITCGGTGAGSRGVRASLTQSPLATEVLLEWDHNVTKEFSVPASMATLNLELSKPNTDLSLVLLDLSDTRLCTRKVSGVQLKISFPTSPGGPRLALKGLKVHSVSILHLQGNVVLNAQLLTGLPNLQRLGVVANNISQSSGPLARYEISDAPALSSIHIAGCIHSVAYDTPLFKSLASLQSVRISQSSMLVLKSGTLVGLPAIKYIYLNENNLQDLEVDSLAGLSSLAHLFLNANGLKRLVNNAFRDLANLKRLNLANNRLSQIQPNAFHGLASLEHLDLSDNRLTILPEMVFAQLHSLQALSLQQNADLQLAAGNDTLCPLESLTTVWTDAPVDCERFGSVRLVQFVSSKGLRRNKKYDCDVSAMPAGQRPCHSWLDRLALLNQAQSQEDKLPSASTNGERQRPSRLNIILLVIFAIVCLIHVLTTAVTIYICRRIKRRQNGDESRNNGGPMGGHKQQRKNPIDLSIASSPEEERLALDASPSGIMSAKDPELVSYHQPGASGNGAKKNNGKDGASGRLNVREKSYDFNEDEHRG